MDTKLSIIEHEDVLEAVKQIMEKLFFLALSARILTDHIRIKCNDKI